MFPPPPSHQNIPEVKHSRYFRFIIAKNISEYTNVLTTSKPKFLMLNDLEQR